MMTKKKRVHLNPVGPYCASSAIRSFLLHTEAQFVFISHSIHFHVRVSFKSKYQYQSVFSFLLNIMMATTYDSKYVLVTGGAGYIGKDQIETNVLKLESRLTCYGPFQGLIQL